MNVCEMHAGVWGCTSEYISAYVCMCVGLSLGKPCVLAYMNAWACGCASVYACVWDESGGPVCLCVSACMNVRVYACECVCADV